MRTTDELEKQHDKSAEHRRTSKWALEKLWKINERDEKTCQPIMNFSKSLMEIWCIELANWMSWFVRFHENFYSIYWIFQLSCENCDFLIGRGWQTISFTDKFSNFKKKIFYEISSAKLIISASKILKIHREPPPVTLQTAKAHKITYVDCGNVEHADKPISDFDSIDGGKKRLEKCLHWVKSEFFCLPSTHDIRKLNTEKKVLLNGFIRFDIDFSRHFQRENENNEEKARFRVHVKHLHKASRGKLSELWKFSETPEHDDVFLSFSLSMTFLFRVSLLRSFWIIYNLLSCFVSE